MSQDIAWGRLDRIRSTVANEDLQQPSRTPGRSSARAASRQPSLVYLVAGGIAVLMYLVGPFAGATWLFELVGLSTAGALVVGVVLYSPQPRLPWLLFTLAQVLFVAGDFFYYTQDLSFPSAADGLYIAFYPLQAAGLLLLVRARTPGRDTASLLDASIVTVALALLSWMYLIDPWTDRSGESELSRLVSMAYPAMDVLLLAVAVRLVMGVGARSAAFVLMLASTVCLIVTDAVYGAIELGGSYNVGSWLDAGWMATYLLWGAAALHPSMRQLSEPARSRDLALSGRRLVVLTGATLIAPCALLVNQWDPIEGFDVSAAAGVSGVMFVLVLARMTGLVLGLRRAARRQEQVRRRETVLRRAATAFAAAPDRAYIRHAAVAGARALLRGVPDVTFTVELADGKGIEVDLDSASDVVIPLSTRTGTFGALVVRRASTAPADVVDALRTLGAQAALALEGAALRDDLARQHSESRVGALVQNSSDVILVVDTDLVIRYVTPSVAQALGHRAEDLVEVLLTSLVDPSDVPVVRTLLARLAQSPGKSVRAEWRMRHGEGHVTDVEAVSTNLLEHPGVNGIVVTAHDITERKALEATLQRQVKELEELDRIRSEFVATVSHELRTPLTSILGEVELLADGDLGELSAGQARGVAMIGRNSNRLRALIEDLLTLGAMEAHALDLQLRPTPIKCLVEDVVGVVRPVAAASSLDLVVDCQWTAGTALLDPDQLDRALVNLLTNAVKFTPPGGTVSLEVRRTDNDLVFVVADTGFGIPEEEQERLFTRFFRSSIATRMAIQGTGLGLVIVKQIVEEHGGWILLESTPGVGTTVTVTIPVGGDREAQAA